MKPKKKEKEEEEEEERMLKKKKRKKEMIWLIHPLCMAQHSHLEKCLESSVLGRSCICPHPSSFESQSKREAFSDTTFKISKPLSSLTWTMAVALELSPGDRDCFLPSQHGCLSSFTILITVGRQDFKYHAE